MSAVVKIGALDVVVESPTVRAVKEYNRHLDAALTAKGTEAVDAWCGAIFALVRKANPSLTMEQLEEEADFLRLMQTCEDVAVAAGVMRRAAPGEANSP